MTEEANQKRFKIALSFPGEKRDFISQVAKLIAEKVGKPSLLYDQYFEAEFARPDLDTYLQNLYHKESELIAVFLCSDYEDKEWCGLEWRAIRDLIKKRETSSVMPFRFDNTEISGLFSTDGYIFLGEGSSRSPQDVATLILDRYYLKPSKPPSVTSIEDTPEQPESDDTLDSAWYEEHIRFQKKIRDQIENEFNGNLLKALRKGFVEVIWTGKGKTGSPTASKLADELIVVDSEGHR